MFQVHGAFEARMPRIAESFFGSFLKFSGCFEKCLAKITSGRVTTNVQKGHRKKVDFDTKQKNDKVDILQR